jgi:hypothetical protein
MLAASYLSPQRQAELSTESPGSLCLEAPSAVEHEPLGVTLQAPQGVRRQEK